MAERMGSLASRNAYARGDYSQYAMVCNADGKHAVGPRYEIEKAWPNKTILAEWSGGYRV